MQNPLASQFASFAQITMHHCSFPVPLPHIFRFAEFLTVLQTYYALSLLFAYAIPSPGNALPHPGLGKCQLVLQEAAQRSLPVKVSTGVSAFWISWARGQRLSLPFFLP